MSESMYVARLRGWANILDCDRLASVVLDDERFAKWPGSLRADKHHHGTGRLAEHVCEVAEIALMLNDYNGSVNKRKLFLAALFHDVGKLWDYEPGKDQLGGFYPHPYEEGVWQQEIIKVEWQASPHRDLIGHVSRSGIVWCEAAKADGWAQDDIDEVLHCILAHHGAKEWGSPVTPKSRMAWILHLSDMMSARLDDCDKKRE